MDTKKLFERLALIISTFITIGNNYFEYIFY